MSTSEDYSQRFPELPFNRWSTGQTVSQAGFGCYRVNTHNPEHVHALQKAIRSGINLIDTSANYGDGAAEELIGSVISQTQSMVGISREELILVTKAGYIQGKNFHRAHKREHHGQAFPQLVKYDEGLWHCIHPEFLQDQLERSLERMKTSYIDVFLLHNPEYFLIHESQNNSELSEARAEFYHRIRLAFEYLESEVEAGRILHYGISSNCFGHAEHLSDYVSLEKCLDIAKAVASELHHFRVAQAPLNLIESGIVNECNNVSNSQSFLEFAKANDINVMVNRVLNAITQNSLIRLSEHAFHGNAVPTNSDISAAIGDLVSHESIMLKNILPSLPFDEHSRETLADFLSPGGHLVTHWESFDGIEHWHDVEVQYLNPRMAEALEAILHHPTPGLTEWITTFKSKTQTLFRLLTHFYAVQSQPRLDRIKAKALEMLGSQYSHLTISQLAFSAPRATDGVTCTLIGARRERYVDEILSSLKLELPVLTRKEWSGLLEIAELV